MVRSIRLSRILVIAVLAAPAVAAAQPPPRMGPRAFHLVRFAGESEVVVRTTWDAGGRSGSVTLRTEGREPVELHSGDRAITAAATRGSTLLTAISEIGASPRMHLVLTDVGGGSAPRRVTADFPDGAGVTPSSVVATADGEGFTVLWQAILAGSFRAARTAMMRIGADGEWIERPRIVEVPWALADIAWNGNGYHVALYFDGQSPSETRLCMVTLSEAGVPEQHPWWASRPGLIDEVRLVRIDARIVAVYRAGSDGTELRRRDVTEVGAWGNDGGPGTLVGRIGRGEEMLVRAAGGSLRIDRRTL